MVPMRNAAEYTTSPRGSGMVRMGYPANHYRLLVSTTSKSEPVS